MNKLEEAREIINRVDLDMIKLFKERMYAATLVANYKKENNLPILDQKREDAIVDKNIKLLDDKELENYYLEWFRTMLKVSKDYQTKLNED
jgi:monofunctional chorismate mutase